MLETRVGHAWQAALARAAQGKAATLQPEVVRAVDAVLQAARAISAYSDWLRVEEEERLASALAALDGPELPDPYREEGGE